MSGNAGDDTEYLIRQMQRVLYQSNGPLSTGGIDEKIDSRRIGETKRVLRKMIDRGLIKTHPSFKYGLSTKARRSLQAGKERDSR